MPYLYTAAEETSRDGMPIIRPLFLEFPHAAPDGHPLDLDAGGEFMFGHSILVAASPSPEEVAPFEVHLPAGIWYDYWTGEKLDRRTSASARDLEIRDQAAIAGAPALKPLMVNPEPADLPVYVRAGSIIPRMPLVQSTNETPRGPLTLRVYPGEDCQGTIYQDDGKTFDFRKGDYLRQKFTCDVAPDGSVMVSMLAPEGRFKPWWSVVRVEVVGLKATSADQSGTKVALPLESSALGSAAEVPYTRAAQTVLFR